MNHVVRLQRSGRGHYAAVNVIKSKLGYQWRTLSQTLGPLKPKTLSESPLGPGLPTGLQSPLRDYCSEAPTLRELKKGKCIQKSRTGYLRFQSKPKGKGHIIITPSHPPALKPNSTSNLSPQSESYPSAGQQHQQSSAHSQHARQQQNAPQNHGQNPTGSRRRLFSTTTTRRGGEGEGDRGRGPSTSMIIPGPPRRGPRPW